MKREDLVLAVLSTSNGGGWTPVQVQKAFFLIDQSALAELGGQAWGFYAYDYGPFDPAVYRVIESLERDGLAAIDGMSRGRTFRLSETGQQRGAAILGALSPETRQYVADLAKWLRSLSFTQLVSAVYKQFPEMKANSVFVED